MDELVSSMDVGEWNYIINSDNQVGTCHDNDGSSFYCLRQPDGWYLVGPDCPREGPFPTMRACQVAYLLTNRTR